MASNKQNNKKNLIIAILVILAVGLSSFIVYKKTNIKEEESSDLFNLSYGATFFYVRNRDDNNNNDYSTGIVELKGYAEVVDREIPNVSNDKYVFFHITDASIGEFLDYLKHMNELDLNGYFTREDALGIGCLEENIISMNRFADKYSEDESIFKLSLDDSKAILSSSKENPVSIIIRKDFDSSLITESPRCTSIITSVELIK